jgi:type VI protein secretion system component Hcp
MSSVAKLFLKLVGTQSGEIKGESRVVNYVDQIELDDWSWTLKPEKRPGTDESIPVPSAISFTKILDRATTPMLLALSVGDLLTATITLEEVAADQFGLELSIEGGRLVDYTMDAKDQEKGALVDETWTLDYRKVTFKHRNTNAQGTSEYEFKRPDWASNTGPGGAKQNRESEIAKLAADHPPGDLDAMWDRVKKLIEENKNKAESKKKSRDTDDD